jgi:D-3-phosphoglycerate dehydrogenase
MSQQGRALLRERDDIEIVEFPNMISADDFEVMLKEHAPVHGVALSARMVKKLRLLKGGSVQRLLVLGRCCTTSLPWTLE